MDNVDCDIILCSQGRNDFMDDQLLYCLRERRFGIDSYTVFKLQKRYKDLYRNVALVNNKEVDHP